MRRVRAALAFLFCGASLVALQAPLHAQVQATAPISVAPAYQQRWDIYAGPSYSHFNPGIGKGIHALNLEGWNADATAWFNQPVGLEFSVRGYYGTIEIPDNSFNITKSDMSEYLFLVGPNFRIRRRENYTLGVHTLIGAANGTFDKGFAGSGIQPSQLSLYNNKVAFGGAFGIWADYNLAPRWSVRVTADWQPTHYGFSTQNEFSGTAGLVYKFGAIH